MAGLVGITARAGERAFVGNFQGQYSCLALENLVPALKNVLISHNHPFQSLHRVEGIPERLRLCAPEYSSIVPLVRMESEGDFLAGSPHFS